MNEKDQAPYKIKALSAADLSPIKGHRTLGEFSVDEKYLTLRWGGYDYDIELKRINTPERALAMLVHISEKAWKGTTPEKLHHLMAWLCARFKWSRQW